MRLLVFLILLFGPSPALLAAENFDLTPVKKWIARQDEVRTVQADFTQTRAFRALQSPVAIPGHLWFSAPQSLRWELGDPAKVILLRNGDTAYFIQPGKKRAERLPADHLGGRADSRNSAQAFAMMKMPLAKDYADFNRQFEVLAVSTQENRCHLEIIPSDASAKKMLTALKLDFDTTTGHLLTFEIALRDGSWLRNEFSNVRLNQKIERRVFDFDLAGYEIVEAK